MRSLTRWLVQESKGAWITVTHIFSQFSDKTTEKVTELMRFELGILRSPA